uniref:Uncharacterized protein n=1 Tax=Anguilla anguilla TaxID=7936 RepID=A0A0E9UYL5_ANGAN
MIFEKRSSKRPSGRTDSL